MRCLIITAVAGLVLARPHPHPRNDVARSLAKERRNEIADGIQHAKHMKGTLHAISKKPQKSSEPAKPIDPEAEEKKREAAEREAKALAASQKQSDELKKEIEEKRHAKETVDNDMAQLHKALTEVTTTTTTTVAQIDSHILDVPDESVAKPAPPSPAQLAKMEEEKREKQEKEREAEEKVKKEEAAEKKAQAKAEKLKEQEKHLHDVANDLKQASHEDNSADSTVISVKKDEAVAAKLIKEIPKVPKQIAAVAQPVSLAPEEKEVEVPKVVQHADEEAKRLLKTKTHERSKEAKWRTQQEIESEVRSNAQSLHEAVMDAESKKVEADMKAQAESLKEVRWAQSKAMKEDVKEEKQAEKDILKPSAPLRMFRPKKFNPKAPEEVAKRATEEDERREGDLQDKMHDMMGNMEKIRSQIGH